MPAMRATQTTSPLSIDARRAKRARRRARIDGALGALPELRVDRLAPILALLQVCRGCADQTERGALLLAYVERIRGEVQALEEKTAALGRASHSDGATVRRALDLLQAFGRISSLDFDIVADEDRAILIRLLQLEYRWCFAAAGTNARAFKTAIGRTGAR